MKRLPRPILIIGVILVVIVLASLVTSCQTLQKTQITPTPQKTQEVQITPTPGTKVASGIYLQAELPAKWSLKEYYDGDGTDMLSSGVDYKGLTAFEILDESAQPLLQVKMVYGIGGVRICDKVYEFPDTDPNYYGVVKTWHEQRLEPDPERVSLSSEYVALEVLGAKIRRVADNWYWHNQSLADKYGLSGFVPECAWMEGVPYQLSGVVTINGKPSGSFFTTLPIPTKDETVLTKLDAAAQSLKIIKTIG